MTASARIGRDFFVRHRIDIAEQMVAHEDLAGLGAVRENGSGAGGVIERDWRAIGGAPLAKMRADTPRQPISGDGQILRSNNESRPTVAVVTPVSQPAHTSRPTDRKLGPRPRPTGS